MPFEALLANEDVQEAERRHLVFCQMDQNGRRLSIWFAYNHHRHSALLRDGIICQCSHSIGANLYQCHEESVEEWLAALRERLEEKP